MLSEKLISLLSNLTKPELNSFEKYLISPFFNENQQLIQLFELVRNDLERADGLNENEQRLSKASVWKQIFGNQVYKDAQMRRLCSNLSTLIKDFLAYQNYRKRAIHAYPHLLPALNTLELSKHFMSTIRKGHSLQENSAIKDANYYYYNFLMERQCDTHQFRLRTKNYALHHLKLADQHLDQFYIIQKLQHFCDLLMYKSIRSIELDLHHFPGFMDHIAQSHLIETPAIALYHQIAVCLSEFDQEEHFQKLKILLDQYHTFFSTSEQLDLYTFAMNYCSVQINLGRLHYYEEIFTIYKIVLEEEIIFLNGELAPGNYKNIITIGCMVREFDWVENFIQKYTSRLPKADQDNDLNYNLAKVYFFTGRYEKVIEQLREVEYKNLVYSLSGKLMLLKTYYELKEYRALDSMMDSFRIYLHRNRIISRDVKQQYMNVLRFVKKLAAIAPYDKTAVAKIKEQVNNCKALADKQWILQKVAERE